MATPALVLVFFGATGCDDAPLGTAWPDMAGDGSDSGDNLTDAELLDVIVISFAIDDRANQAYGLEDGLAWKTTFDYDPETNFVLGVDPAAAPPFPMLWDDGPHSAGGHEPEGSEAGDHVWSATVFHARPSWDITYSYGAVRGSSGGSAGNWIWPTGRLASFTVSSAASSDIHLADWEIRSFGRVDYRITVDGNRLDPVFLDTVPLDVSILGLPWGIVWLPASDDGSQDDVPGDGIFAFVASAHFGADCTKSTFRFCAQTGLEHSGDTPAFKVFIDGVEYALAGVPLADGVTVEVGRVVDDEGNAVLDWTPVDVNVKTFDWDPEQPGQHPLDSILGTWLVATIPQVALNVSVDDTALAAFTAADGLALAGTFGLKVGVLSYDPEENGPFPPLYDDGPWTSGGHEPDGAVAGDHVWGLTAWLDSPLDDTRFEYRVIRGSVDGSDGPLVAPDAAGTFNVLAGQVAPVTIGPVTVAP